MRRVHPELYYYKTKAGRKVDFLVPARGRPQALLDGMISFWLGLSGASDLD